MVEKPNRPIFHAFKRVKLPNQPHALRVCCLYIERIRRFRKCRISLRVSARNHPIVPVSLAAHRQGQHMPSLVPIFGHLPSFLTDVDHEIVDGCFRPAVIPRLTDESRCPDESAGVRPPDADLAVQPDGFQMDLIEGMRPMILYRGNEVAEHLAPVRLDDHAGVLQYLLYGFHRHAALFGIGDG